MTPSELADQIETGTVLRAERAAAAAMVREAERLLRAPNTGSGVWEIQVQAWLEGRTP